MIITCPACGKKNEGVMECWRCGCELAVLQKIIEVAEATLLDGQKSLACGEAAAAVYQARKSWQLKKSPEAAHFAFLASLAIGDFTQAGRWYVLSGEFTFLPTSPFLPSQKNIL
ncbi:MAG: hypothetical protein ABFD75_08970 [Smithella sp.]